MAGEEEVVGRIRFSSNFTSLPLPLKPHRTTHTCMLFVHVQGAAAIYAFGSDRWLQLGLGEAWAERGGPICRKPQQVTTLKGPVHGVAAGKRATSALLWSFVVVVACAHDDDATEPTNTNDNITNHTRARRPQEGTIASSSSAPTCGARATGSLGSWAPGRASTLGGR